MESNSEGLAFGAGKVETTLIDEGKYEVEIGKIEQKETKSHKKYLSIGFRIRKDVDQKFKGLWVWYSIFDKDTEMSRGVYDFNAINDLILTQEGMPGYKDHFKSFDELLLYLNGLHMTVNILQVDDDYTGGLKNVVDKKTIGKSEWDASHPADGDLKPVGDPNEGVKGKNLDSVDVVDDDLPF